MCCLKCCHCARAMNDSPIHLRAMYGLQANLGELLPSAAMNVGSTSSERVSQFACEDGSTSRKGAVR